MIRCSGVGTAAGRGHIAPPETQSTNQLLCEIARADRVANGGFVAVPNAGSCNYREAAAHLAQAAALIQTVETSNERLGWLIEECLQLVKRRAL